MVGIATTNQENHVSVGLCINTSVDNQQREHVGTKPAIERNTTAVDLEAIAVGGSPGDVPRSCAQEMFPEDVPRTS